MSQGTDRQCIEILTWDKVRNIVKKHEPMLFKLIEDFSPTDKYKFILTRYPYGGKILHKGKMHFPVDRKRTLPIDHPQISNEIKKQLSYRFCTAGLMLSKITEIFCENDERVIPIKLYYTGELFGLWQIFDPQVTGLTKNVWKITAGTRSAFMLPMISNAAGHTRLKRDLGIHTHLPKTLLDHHRVFSDIAEQAEEKWICKVLYLGNEWINLIDENRYKPLKEYLVTKAWEQSYHCRAQVAYDAANEAFAKAIERKHMRVRPYILNTANYLLTISKNLSPAFAPANGDEEALPVRTIQDAYINHYLLKDYAPIIMRPEYITNQFNQCIYYSLSFPTLLLTSPKTRNTPYIMADLRDLKLLMEIAEEYFVDVPVNYQYFHSEKDRFNEISAATHLPNLDNHLMHSTREYENKKFPTHSQFFKGCIRLDSKS